MADETIKAIVATATLDSSGFEKGVTRVEDSLKRLKESLGKSGEDTKQLESSLKQVGETIGKSFESGARKIDESTKKINDSLKELSERLSKTATKTSKKADSASEDIGKIGKETVKAGKAFKESGKHSLSFFNPLTKSVFGFAASLFTLKNAISLTVSAAEKFSNIHAATRETGLTEQQIQARRYTEKQLNIPEGTYEGIAANLNNIRGKTGIGQYPSGELARALIKLNIYGDTVSNKKSIDEVVSKAIRNSRRLPATERRSLLGYFGGGVYGGLSDKDYNKNDAEYRRNLNIETERRKSGVYELGERNREQYIKVQQNLERALNDLFVNNIPLLTRAIELLTSVITVITDPIEAISSGFKKSIEGLNKNPESRFRDNNEIAPWYKKQQALDFGVPLKEIPKEATNHQLLELSKKYWPEHQKKMEKIREKVIERNAKILSGNNPLYGNYSLSLPQTTGSPTTNNVTINQTNNLRTDKPAEFAREAAVDRSQAKRLSSALALRS